MKREITFKGHKKKPIRVSINRPLNQSYIYICYIQAFSISLWWFLTTQKETDSVSEFIENVMISFRCRCMKQCLHLFVYVIIYVHYVKMCKLEKPNSTKVIVRLNDLKNQKNRCGFPLSEGCNWTCFLVTFAWSIQHINLLSLDSLLR